MKKKKRGRRRIRRKKTLEIAYQNETVRKQKQKKSLASSRDSKYSTVREINKVCANDKALLGAVGGNGL